MIKELHNHIINEIQQSTRTDTVFVVSAVIFNLVALAINWSTATESDPGSGVWIMIVLTAAILLINLISIRAVTAGNNIRSRLTKGLIDMYKDNSVDKYYDSRLILNYETRSKLYTTVLVILGSIAIIIPVIEKFTG